MQKILRGAFTAALVVMTAAVLVWLFHPWIVGGESPFEHVNEAEGISLQAVEGSASATGVIVRFVNETDSQWQFGQEFWIEKRAGDTWRELPTMRERSFDALAYLIAPESSREEVYSFEDGYARLTSGTYRIVVEVMREKSGGWESQYIAAEFTLG